MVKTRHSLLAATLLVAVTIMAGCGGGGGGKSNVDNEPVPPPTSITDVTENKQAILAYLSDLTNDVKPGVISGQNCGHGNEIAASGLYNQYIEKLHNNTGQYVGIVGIDYEYMREFTLDELLQANNFLKRHWLQGGLVTINWS
ncbi:MAG TPA: hypothetical protein VHR47_12750, partial [Bacillota bacterium]|nr:hypothetical protein [Bacillota bacterium]